MDPREMEALVQRLVKNPHDQDAIARAYEAGQRDPRSYAMLLEKVGATTGDPVFASHWLTEAANVWSSTLGDAHRAAKALMIAIDRDPTQPTPAERLGELYREKGDVKALVALLERRGKALSALVQQDPELRAPLSAIHEELGRLWSEPPLSQTKKALENYARAVECDPGNQYAIYAVRELYKASGRWAEAIPYFELEQRLVTDTERQLALYQDEAEVRKNAGDAAGAIAALRGARQVEGGQDPTLKQQLATAVLECVRAGQRVSSEDRTEGAALFVELAEEFQGEHGFSYSTCALELEGSNDRAVQLAIYYAGQLGRENEVAPRAAAYIKENPQGALVPEARELVSRAMEAGAFDESMLEALAPGEGASAPERLRGLLEIGAALARKGKKNEAAQHYRDVLSIEPTNEEAVGFMETYLRQGRKYVELRDLLLTAARTPDVIEETRRNWLREAAGLCETQLRDMDGAITAWRELVELDPEDEGPRSQLKRLLEKANRWEDLAELLQREAEQTDDVETRISIEKAVAKIHEQKRRDPVATGEAWARIAELSPDDEAAIGTALRHFERAQRVDLAAKVIADNIGSISDDRARGQLFKRLAELREAAGEIAGAGEAYAEGAALGKDATLWEAAERCFVQVEAWDQAATAIDERAHLVSRPEERATLLAKEADYLSRAGDEASATLQLEHAADLEPANETYAEALEQRYTEADRQADLAAFLLRRAEKLKDRTRRTELRKRAAILQRDALEDPAQARETLQLILEDGDDFEALSLLADDAEQRGEYNEAIGYLHRWERASDDPAQKAVVVQREARLLIDGLDDARGAIEKYERVLSDFDAKNEDALKSIAELYDRLEEPKGAAEALERRLKISENPETKLEIANRLADLYETELDEPEAAIRALDVVRELDPEDFGALERVCELAERLELWPRLAEDLSALSEIEGDEAELSRMTRRLAEILHEKLERSDDALAALLVVADNGDEACREEYVRLADSLGWKGIVAMKLVEWNAEAVVGPKRNEAFRGAFDRFVEVGRKADAANVAKELARTRAADDKLAGQLEAIAIELKDLDALGVAHDLLVEELTGPARAEEMVRQAETLLQAGVEPLSALRHGEQALSSVPPDSVEPLLERLSKLAPTPEQVIDLYERQVMRCKAPADRLSALTRAAQVAAKHGAMDRARGFFDIALSGPVQDDTLGQFEAAAHETDQELGGDKLRRTLAEAMSAGGQGSRDGGRTRAGLLRRAALLVYRELNDADTAFRWLGDGLVAHVDDEGLSALEDLADEMGEPKRAEGVFTRALEEVFDGPLVRKLLARRAALRREKLDDKPGAAQDYKRLHDLSPSDADVMEQLRQLYTDLGDYRGMVQLFEDQILRGKKPEARLDLARQVARLWEERLGDPREAADAWRRVLRMKSGDPEATEGLERAKTNMLKHRSEPDIPSAPEQSKPLASPEPLAAPPPAAELEPPPGAEAQPPPSLPRSEAEPLGTPASTEGDDTLPGGDPSAAAPIAEPPLEAKPKGKGKGKGKKGDKERESELPPPVLTEPHLTATNGAAAPGADVPSDADAAPLEPEGIAPLAAPPLEPTPAPPPSSPVTEPEPESGLSSAPARVSAKPPPPPRGGSRPPAPPGTRPPPPPPPGARSSGMPRPPPPPGARVSAPPPPPPRSSGAPSRGSVPPPLPGAPATKPQDDGDDIDMTVDDSELMD